MFVEEGRHPNFLFLVTPVVCAPLDMVRLRGRFQLGRSAG